MRSACSKNRNSHARAEQATPVALPGVIGNPELGLVPDPRPPAPPSRRARDGALAARFARSGRDLTRTVPTAVAPLARWPSKARPAPTHTPHDAVTLGRPPPATHAPAHASTPRPLRSVPGDCGGGTHHAPAPCRTA